MDNISLECPKCGATMTLHPEKSEAVCAYCGHTILLKNEQPDVKKIRSAKRLPYIITICILASLICVSFLITRHSKTKINPFDYLEISFSGTNGEGEAIINTLNDKDDIDASNLQYEVSPSEDLSEGDYVTVNVISINNKYRLTSSSKKYEVSGLQQYLTDLNNLQKGQLQTIYAKNSELQEYNLGSAYSDVKVGAITPVRICLMTDHNKVSVLYVISKTTCTQDNLSKTHYLVSELDHVVVADDNISFGYSQYSGNLSSTVSENGGGFIFSYTSLDAASADIKSSDVSLTYSEMRLK